jgi:uncharacterized SAM-binding protein YcdF (DUF218 family)/glycosyltransferase involved in cell wall biosynthesis
MLTRHNVVCFSTIDWDFIWQGHQEIMASLAQHGNRVLFVENTGVRSPRFSDLPRLRHRLRNWWRGFKGFREERPNLFVYSPLVLPFPYSRLARWLNRVLLRRALLRWMEATKFYRPIVWTFLPTPLVRDLIRHLDPELTIYYCIDDLASSSRGARRIRTSEERLLRDADLVFVTSERLRERAARLSDRVHLFPFGVNYASFRQAGEGDEVPGEIARLGRPVAGYVGGVHQWVDQALLAEVAERMPEMTFALVGPIQTDVSRLSGRANIHLLGARPHAELPRYLRGFDLGLIPYRMTEYTSHVYPTKLNEYLAAGIPVVATSLPEICRFNAEHGGVVEVAGDADAFAKAIVTALGAKSAAEVSRRLEVARLNSWEERIARMSDLIERTLTARRLSGERWDVRLRRVYRTARRRLAQALIVTAASYLLLFQTPFLWAVAEPLRIVETPRSADAIVVFAAGVGESGKAGGGYQERVKHAVDLYRTGLAPRLVFSSGYEFAFEEAKVMRELAMGLGVPQEAIVLESKSASTYENVAFVQAILDAHGWRRILLVSSPYHMRRALLTWKKVAPGTRVVSTPVPSSQFYAHGWGANLDQVRGIAQEYVAIAVYWWRGWI